MLVDSHCHLDAAEFDEDRDAVLERARAVGVGAMVVPAVERANFGAVAFLCRENPDCFPAFGIHPMYVDRARDEDLGALRRCLANEPAVAVGEIGLDYFVTPRDEAQQLKFFSEQLRIARDFGLPVILHVRRAVDHVLRELRRFRPRGGIAHAFNGSRQQADEFIKLGFALGFGGAMTYPRAHRIRDMAASLPLDCLVLETDAPDIAPEWKAKQRNEPAELNRIAAVLADLRNCPVADVISATGSTVLRVLAPMQKR
ncbi:MAG TPA: TatD family hydrolase [Rhodocyclaceae bacterium]|nr:TatD family hydrolase [Rhodocyclaceae bacterium]